MRTLLLALLTILTLLALFGQNTYKGLPLLKASSNIADYKIDNELVKGQ